MYACNSNLASWLQAQRQAEQAQQAAEEQRAKTLAEAQATVDSAEKAAAATLREAEARASQLTQQQEAQAKQASEAQAEASAALAQAKKEAAAIVQEAQAKAAQMLQQQEVQGKQDVEATKQQVCALMLDCSCCITCLAAEDRYLERSPIRCLSCNIPIKVYLILLVLHDVRSAVTSATLLSKISITWLFRNT